MVYDLAKRFLISMEGNQCYNVPEGVDSSRTLIRSTHAPGTNNLLFSIKSKANDRACNHRMKFRLHVRLFGRSK